MSCRPQPRALVAIAAAVLTLSLAPAAAAEETLTEDVGMGVLSAVCTLVYTPLKIAYAAGGTMVAGLVFLWSAGDIDTTQQVLRTTAGGDYVVTRDHLRGLKVLEFGGSEGS